MGNVRFMPPLFGYNIFKGNSLYGFMIFGLMNSLYVYVRCPFPVVLHFEGRFLTSKQVSCCAEASKRLV